MLRRQKLWITGVWAAATLGMLSLVGSGMLTRSHAGDGEQTGALPVLYDAPTFALTDQTGQSISKQSLAGKVWIASLFYTECPGICPAMTGRLHTLQESISDPNVLLISFSVDPVRDTPEKMKLYADKLAADSARWRFVTGTETQMFNLARGLKLGAQPAGQTAPIIHSENALLIDAAGHVRGVYHTDDSESMRHLADDAKTLASERAS